MRKYLKSELLKQRKSFFSLLIWIMPVAALLIAYFLMGPWYIQTAAFNWWYILFLPFTFIFIASSIIKKEKKYYFHGLFAVVEDKRRLWYGKLMVATLYLFCTCMIFGILIVICGVFFNEQITPLRSMSASLVLIISFAWQIPFFMIITLKANVLVSLLCGVGCNFLLACFCAPGKLWWIPFAIPSRLMCPVIGILPNNLLLSPDDPLASGNVIAVGLIISLCLYAFTAVFTANIFAKQEA